MKKCNPEITFDPAFGSLYFFDENTTLVESPFIIINFTPVDFFGRVRNTLGVKFNIHDDLFLILFVFYIEFSVGRHLLSLRFNNN